MLFDRENRNLPRLSPCSCWSRRGDPRRAHSSACATWSRRVKPDSEEEGSRQYWWSADYCYRKARSVKYDTLHMKGSCQGLDCPWRRPCQEKGKIVILKNRLLSACLHWALLTTISGCSRPWIDSPRRDCQVASWRSRRAPLAETFRAKPVALDRWPWRTSWF